MGAKTSCVAPSVFDTSIVNILIGHTGHFKKNWTMFYQPISLAIYNRMDW